MLGFWLFFAGEESFEDGADGGLDEEDLAEVGEGEVEAEGFEPGGEEGEDGEAGGVGVVEDGGEEGHEGDHDEDGGFDDGVFDGVGAGGFEVEVFGGEFFGERGADEAFAGEGEGEFDEHDGPDGDLVAEDGDAADGFDGGEDAGGFRAGGGGGGEEGGAVDDEEAIEDERADGDDYRDEGVKKFLSFRLWHGFLSFSSVIRFMGRRPDMWQLKI